MEAQIEALQREVAGLRQAVMTLLDTVGSRMSTAEVCAHFKAHRNTIRNWRQHRDFPAPDLAGRYLRSEVLEWERDQRSKRAI
jgi:hypothetical protein